MTSRTRLASGLLLVPPALILLGNVLAALEDRWAGDLLTGLPLAVFLIVVGVHLWRGSPWTGPVALVASGGIVLLFLLYHVAAAQVWGWESWAKAPVPAYLLEFLPPIACAAAFALLVSDASLGDARRRALALSLAALAIEIGLMALIAVLGIGSVFGGRAWYHLVLGYTQLPGEMILGQMGMCCGYENETIISDWVDLHWGGITRHGIPTLVVANALGLVPLAYLLRRLSPRRKTALA
jgi:hypothetical protein